MPPEGSITILSLDEKPDDEVIWEWSKGLEWVRWLFAEFPVRLERLSIEPGPYPSQRWDGFVEQLFIPVLAPKLKQAWLAAQEGRTRDLAALARNLDQILPTSLRSPSSEAAEQLLSTTASTLHQGVLGKHRAAIEDGRCPAHLLTVWACLGSVYQLGLANLCAEYLAVEWRMLRRGQTESEPVGQHSIAGLTSQFLHGHLIAGHPGD